MLFGKKKKDVYTAQDVKDWDASFKKGYPLWEKGEIERKAGNIDKAISLYDQAKKTGYLVPALYKSYALAYRKKKDLDGEIKILEEGIARLNAAKGNYENGVRDLAEQLDKAKKKK